MRTTQTATFRPHSLQPIPRYPSQLSWTLEIYIYGSAHVNTSQNLFALRATGLVRSALQKWESDAEQNVQALARGLLRARSVVVTNLCLVRTVSDTLFCSPSSQSADMQAACKGYSTWKSPYDALARVCEVAYRALGPSSEGSSPGQLWRNVACAQSTDRELSHR